MALRTNSRSSGDAEPKTSATFIGNATLVLRVGGVTILTDPSFLHAGAHVHVGYGVFAKRLLDPALEFARLPPLDAILLSHLHADHWDRAAERSIDRGTPIVTTPAAASLLEKRGFKRTVPLPMSTTKRLAGSSGGSVDITAVPARHGPPFERLLPETHGHLLDTTMPDGRTLRIYISGDTLVFDGIRKIAEGFPRIDVAFVHLGGTRIPHRRICMLVTLDAKGGIDMLRILAPRTFIPIHTDDWSLFGSSLRDFLEAADADGRGTASASSAVETRSISRRSRNRRRCTRITICYRTRPPEVDQGALIGAFGTPPLPPASSTTNRTRIARCCRARRSR